MEHVAIIMDGNGRWAEARGLTRSDGHKAGADNISRIADAARELGLKYLTLYAFSTENWKRPPAEVACLMGLISEITEKRLPDMMKNNIRLRTIGRTSDLPLLARKSLLKCIDETKNNTGLTINIALSYGGRAEIVDAVNKILAEKKTGDKIDEKEFINYLYAPDIPDPDLLIRTSGELRLSNFLLWELSYSEIYVTDTHWPDFDKEALQKAIDSFGKRKRRFGGLNK
ncbi:MAG: isoprenyl transferase [Lentisphaeria bacterium]|nr:isoprenyl transferase [Lentisphaeria bacterium]